MEQVEKLVQAISVVVMWGESGVGKTYLGAQLAKQLSKDYKVCWLDREGLTLDELLLQVNEFLKANGEYGFVTTYAEDKITSKNKIPALVQIISTSKVAKYAFFLDWFQLANHSEIKPFIERFRTYGGKSRVVLIDHSPERSLGVLLAGKVQKFQVEGFDYGEAVKYINQRCKVLGTECSLEDMTAVFEKTAGHPLAIDLIIQWRCLLGNSMGNVLRSLVEYDKRYGAELNKRLLENVAAHLDQEEREALSRLSVFRTPVKRSVWLYVDVLENLGESLLQRRLLTRVNCDKFQMHPLIAEFWRASQSKEEMSRWHEKAAGYYWDQGKQSSLDTLDRRAYLESHFHWRETGQVEAAAWVLNELVSRLHEKERLPSERLPGLKEWLVKLNKTVFVDKPWLLLEKGRKLEKQGCIKDAEDVFQQAYEIFEQEGDKLGASVALYYVGKMRHLIRQPELALQALKSVLEMAKSRSDLPMQIRTLGKMVGCYTDLGRYEDAQNAAHSASELAQDSGDYLGLALILYRKGSIERHQSNFWKAEEFFRESATAFSGLGNIYGESKSWARLGICQQFQSKFEQATESLKRAIELKKLINDGHGVARDLDYLADIYSRLGLYEKAEASYRESLAIKEGGGGIQPDLYGQIKTYNNLARVALSTGRLDEADEAIQKSEERIDKQNPRYVGVNGSRLMIRGDLQFTQGEYEAALQLYEEAAVCFSSPNPEVPHSHARVLFSLGRIHLTLGHLSLAEQHLENSLASFQKYRMGYHEALALTYLARLKALTSPLEEAYNQNQKAMNIAKEINAQHLFIVCLETQGLIEEKQLLKRFSQKQAAKDLIEPVWKWYDDAIQKLAQWKAILDIARLQVKKKLWLFTVKHLYKDPISKDDAYGLLRAEQTEQLVKYAIYIELLNTKYTLGILKSISSGMASQIANFALRILAPTALQFGFNKLREELEEVAFAFLYPNEYEQINQALEISFPEREEFIQDLNWELENLLADAQIQAEIYPRAKTIYSIYKKKEARKVRLDNILDIVGFRIVTQTESECYKVLALVQEIGSFFEGEGILKESLRDYIKNPKANGYRSIHININIKYGELEPRIVEFQIRTHRMHLAAEVGIGLLGLDQASHSRYKNPATYARPSSKRNYELAQRQRLNLVIECDKSSVVTIGNLIRSSKFELLSVDLEQSPEKRIILWLEMAAKSRRLGKEQEEFKAAKEQLIINMRKFKGVFLVDENINHLEISRFNSSFENKALLLQELTSTSSDFKKFIYLITPKGHVKKLPIGATPIDFAYRIHTEMGNQCAGAIVNDQMVTLDTPLKNGDIVEIIKRENTHPSLDWLHFVVTNSARNRIRQWYKRSHWEENIARGRELLQKELQRELGKKGLEALLKSEQMQVVVEQFNYRNVEDLLANLGYGEIRLNQVVNRIREATNAQQSIENTSESSTTPATTPHIIHTSSSSKSPITGVEGLLYRLARCCNPVPGEPIIGVVTLGGGGISIHRQECRNRENVPVVRLITVSWNHTENQTYPVDVQIKVIDRIGVLQDILSCLSHEKINVRKVQVQTYPDKSAAIDLRIDICDHKQLRRVFVKIKKMPECLLIYRLSQVNE